MEHLPIGYILADRYRIERYLGRGGFSCTYVAISIADGAVVAVKELLISGISLRGADGITVITPDASRRPIVEKVMRKFIDEAKALQAISHPGIVHVHSFFTANDTAYYVMDYIEGESLAGMLKSRGPLPEAEAVGYITQVAEALKHIHSTNRLHLDVKPANIMVNGYGRAVLIDFGASKQYDPDSGENHSTLMGKTPNYAPIEQWGRNVERFHAATDIYSLGATLYKLLIGITPTCATERVAGTPLQPLPPSISPAVARAIKCAMEIRHIDRPQSIDQFLRILSSQEQVDDELEVTVVDIRDCDTVFDSRSGKSEGSAVLDLNRLASEEKKSKDKTTPKVVSDSSPWMTIWRNPSTRLVILIAAAALVAVIVTLVVLLASSGKSHKSSSDTATTSSVSANSTERKGSEEDWQMVNEFVSKMQANKGMEVIDGATIRGASLHDGNHLLIEFDVKTTKALSERKVQRVMQKDKNDFIASLRQSPSNPVKNCDITITVKYYQGNIVIGSYTITPAEM